MRGPRWPPQPRFGARLVAAVQRHRATAVAITARLNVGQLVAEERDAGLPSEAGRLLQGRRLLQGTMPQSERA